MNLMETLREYNNIDDRIEVEKLSIRMGTDYIKEFYKTLDSLELGGQAPGDQTKDALPAAAEQVKAKLDQDGWQHLMEYQRLMQMKITCMRAMQTLCDDDARLLRERAIEGKSWRQLLPAYSYCESQLRRRFSKALACFSKAFHEIEVTNDVK